MTMQENNSPSLGRELEESLAAPAKPLAPAPNAAVSGDCERLLPQLIDQAVKCGARVILTSAGYELEGFYKLGPMRLEPAVDNSCLVAIDKKETRTNVKSFDDLVRLNYDCWKKCRDKGYAYINPGREWVEEFSRLNLIKRQVIYVPGED